MRTRLQQLGFASLTLFAFAATVPAANISLTTVDPGGSSSLTATLPNKWSDGLAPNAANDYFTSSFFVRTPTTGGGVTFAGHSLTLQEPSGQGLPMRSILY